MNDYKREDLALKFDVHFYLLNTKSITTKKSLYKMSIISFFKIKDLTLTCLYIFHIVKVIINLPQ